MSRRKSCLADPTAPAELGKEKQVRPVFQKVGERVHVQRKQEFGLDVLRGILQEEIGGLGYGCKIRGRTRIQLRSTISQKLSRSGHFRGGGGEASLQREKDRVKWNSEKANSNREPKQQRKKE